MSVARKTALQSQIEDTDIRMPSTVQVALPLARNAQPMVIFFVIR